MSKQTRLTHLRQKRAEAEEALHQIMTGQQPRAFTDQNGESVQYNAASVGKLRTYIAQLDRQIALLLNRRASFKGPMRGYF